MTPLPADEDRVKAPSIPAPRRSGRRPGESGTREAILKAARTVFSQRGYAGATMRAIAREAEVDAALIHHFFDSKAGVFQAAITEDYRIPDLVEEMAAAGPERMGEVFVRGYLAMWEESTTRSSMMAVLRTAISDEEASRHLRDFMTNQVIVPAVKVIGGSDAKLRAALVGTQLVGVALSRYVVKVEPIASADIETVVKALAPTLQRYLTGTLSSVSGSRGAWEERACRAPAGPQGLFQEPEY